MNRYGRVYMCDTFDGAPKLGCVFCVPSRVGTRLCDGPPPTGSRLTTCDKRMCPGCATRTKPNHDLCPDCIRAGVRS